MIRLDENTNYAALIRSLMANAGIRPSALAKATGRSPDVVATWRSGRRAPGVTALVQIVGALGYELTLTPKAETPALSPDVLPEPEVARCVDGCPAAISGLCVSMTEGFAVCESDECVHHESGRREPELRCLEPTCPDFGDPDFGEGTCPAERADPTAKRAAHQARHTPGETP